MDKGIISTYLKKENFFKFIFSFKLFSDGNDIYYVLEVSARDADDVNIDDVISTLTLASKKLEKLENIFDGIFYLTKEKMTKIGMVGKTDAIFTPKKTKVGNKAKHYVSYTISDKDSTLLNFILDPSPPYAAYDEL